MIDPKFIGTGSEPASVEVEKSQIRFFAKTIGEANPIHHDEAAARAAGYRSLVAPPTFAFCLQSMAQSDSGGPSILKRLGVDLSRILHGEQQFTYHAPICAGDTVTFRDRIADIYAKKGGALEFIVNDIEATNDRGEKVVTMRTVIVVRN